MLFEFFTVLLMKKFLFKIFFQNKYYERHPEVCLLTPPPSTLIWDPEDRLGLCCFRSFIELMTSNFPCSSAPQRALQELPSG